MDATRLNSTTTVQTAPPTFGEALKQSWANTFAKSKALGALRVLANLTVVGALIDLAASGIAHSLGKLGRNAQPVPPTRVAQQQQPLPQDDQVRPTVSPRDVFSGSRLDDSGSSSGARVTAWTPSKSLGVERDDLDAPGILSPPSRPQQGVHALHTQAFKAFFEADVTFGVPGAKPEERSKQGTITINGREYDYQATGKVAKGSGAGIWMVTLTDSSGGGAPTEFVIKANPKKGDDSDPFMQEFYQVGREKDLREVQVLDLMSGNDHALQFHGGYSLPDGTLVYGMEKGSGDMLTVLEARQQEKEDGTLGPDRGVDSRLKEMSRALADLHATDQVHGDIKSDNFMLGQDGTARIADFGECYVTDVGVRQETLKGDVQRFAVLAFNLRQGTKETTDSVPGELRKLVRQQEALMQQQVDDLIKTQTQLISDLESSGGDPEMIEDLQAQVTALKDPVRKLDALIAISGGDLDPTVRELAINKLLLEAATVTDPTQDYMGGFSSRFARLLG